MHLNFWCNKCYFGLNNSVQEQPSLRKRKQTHDSPSHIHTRPHTPSIYMYNFI